MRQVIMATTAGFLGGILASWLVLAVAPAGAKEKTVFAESFAIVNAEGKVRAALALSKGEAVGLVLVRPDGNLSSQLMVGEDGESRLTFFDEQGKTARMIHR